MEKTLQWFDVCVVCALPEEVKAFLSVVQQQSKGPTQERISPRYRYSYHIATLKNCNGEPLNIHISWLPRYGPQEMVLHLSRVLEECQPRMALMSGICAGDSQRVQPGDLVVAERTFAYDSGKFALDEYGRTVHLHDTMTYQLDPAILQFLGLFDNWKPLVANLERPPSSPPQREPVCHLKAMASGSAVRADRPFEDVQVPVRTAVAIDMEGAAFGLTMSRHPLLPWLIVKGVCDYADQHKNDSYHDYASRASALYALSFIQAYVTNERLPRPRDTSSLHREPPGIWNVPYPRNSYFTGRDQQLDTLIHQFAPRAQEEGTTPRRAALTQPRAMKGLGGIGKTQIAVEYAYRARDSGHFTHIFWVNASEETLLTSFTALADLLPAFPETEKTALVTEIKRWLERCELPWLLIFDNADDIPALQEYLPQCGNGGVLLTTRADAVGSLGASSLQVEDMGLLEGTQFLLRRAQYQQPSDEEQNTATNVVIALESFPLALDQAGAFIEETHCSFDDYLQMYQTRRQDLLAQRGLQTTSYPHSVATTWSLSFQKVEQANPAAAELLRLCAFLAPDKIPEELIRDGAAHWSPLLRQAATDLLTFNEMIKALLTFSLIKRLTETGTLSIHRLVQAVQKDMIEPEMQSQWAHRVVRALHQVFPHDPRDPATWAQCLRYLDQAQVCHTLIVHYTLSLREAAHLLNRAGFYLEKQGLYTIAEPLYLRALKICLKLPGSPSSDLANCLQNLADLYYIQGKYTEAERLHQRILAISKRNLEAAYLAIASSFNSLAALYDDQGKGAEAEQYYQQAQIINGQLLKDPYSNAGHILNNQAFLLAHAGKYAEAEQVYGRALELYQQQFGTQHLFTAQCFNNLGDLYTIQGRYKDAERVFQKARTIREQVGGPEHIDTAQSIWRLAVSARRKRENQNALSLYQQALAIYIQALGPGHARTQSLQREYFAFRRTMG
ncbi:MAG TPA: FxSxx-COOH system tetratricopeptide repeat protein [Ktedonobacteraceae bacterium]